MIKKKSMKKRYKRRNNDEEKQKRRKNGRMEKLGLKGGRSSLVGGSRSTSALLKSLHALKGREITFGSTSTRNI